MLACYMGGHFAHESNTRVKGEINQCKSGLKKYFHYGKGGCPLQPSFITFRYTSPAIITIDLAYPDLVGSRRIYTLAAEEFTRHFFH